MIPGAEPNGPASAQGSLPKVNSLENLTKGHEVLAGSGEYES